MLTLATLWWLSFWTAVGLCVGSFLNAVIHRLPRQKSLRDPIWSFCPVCRHRIRWFDNLPVLSFVLLSGRCRHCGVPISTRYPVIEMSMALIVLMLVDSFFIGQVRTGLSTSVFGLTDRLSYDWPILLAHITLFACLLSMSAIDLEHYWVDIRFTNLATVVGFACHAMWTPAHSRDWVRPSDTTAVVSLFALAGLGITWVVVACQPPADVEGDEQEPDEEAEVFPEVTRARKPPPSLVSGPRAAGWVAGVLLLGTFVMLALDEANAVASLELRHTGRALLPLLMFFFLIVWESCAQRPSDIQIAEAIHQERHTARRMVLTELVHFLPAIVTGAFGLWLMTRGGEIPERISSGLHAGARIDGIAMMRNWSPLTGMATAASGYIIAGALGWAVRIVFTLILGKEAFGTGDIHLMSAAGCVAGWPVVVLGFFLTCVLAMAGWLIALPFKKTRALPLGPWLAISLLAVVLYYDGILSTPTVSRLIDAVQYLLLGQGSTS